MGIGSRDTVTAKENSVIAPTDGAADNVEAAKSGPDRLVSSKTRHFMASSYKKELLCAIAGDGMQVGIDLVMGSRATDFTYERRKAIDNRVGVSAAETARAS